ncbi:MAG: hypothetical protein INR71_05245 [Terriglobus roseus]|nr:hypothetical protein [Terriglobus roseus]
MNQVAGPYAAPNSAGLASLPSSTTPASAPQAYDAYGTPPPRGQQPPSSADLQQFAGHGSPHGFPQHHPGMPPHAYGQDASVMKGGPMGPTSFPPQQQQQAFIGE